MRDWLTRLLRGPAPPAVEERDPPPVTCPRPADSPAERRLAAATQHANRKIEEAEVATRRALAVANQRSSNPLGNLLADRGK